MAYSFWHITNRNRLRSLWGFTLIELLISVSIIAILISIAVVQYSSVNKRSRDGKRKADLEQIRTALEMYRADKGEYPCGSARLTCKGTSGGFGYNGEGEGYVNNVPGASTCYDADLENVLENNKYITNMPHDIYGGECSGVVGYAYMYYFQTANAPGRDYCLYARLENPPTGDDVCSTDCPQYPLGDDGYGKNYCVKNP